MENSKRVIEARGSDEEIAMQNATLALDPAISAWVKENLRWLDGTPAEVLLAAVRGDPWHDERVRHTRSALAEYIQYRDVLWPKPSEATRAKCLTDVKRLASKAEDPDAPVKTGDIRVLPGLTHVVYFLAVKPWENSDGTWFVCGLSPLGWPMYSEEMQLGLDDDCPKYVAQTWNSRTLFKQTLARSYKVGSVPIKYVNAIWQLVLRGMGAKNVLEGWEDACTGATGTCDPNDPRLEYLRREHINWAKIDDDELSILDGDHVLPHRRPRRKHPRRRR